MIPSAVQRVLWCILALAVSSVWAELAGSPGTNQPATVSRSGFRVLVLAESGGHHVAFTQAARPWLRRLGEENGFELDYVPASSIKIGGHLYAGSIQILNQHALLP
ncbi:MAG TPA: hypothetical protein VIN67_08080 [Desulfobaccales bacterium]